MADTSAVGVRFRQEQVVRDVLAAWDKECRESYSVKGLAYADARERAAGRVVDALANLI